MVTFHIYIYDQLEVCYFVLFEEWIYLLFFQITIQWSWGNLFKSLHFYQWQYIILTHTNFLYLPTSGCFILLHKSVYSSVLYILKQLNCSKLKYLTKLAIFSFQCFSTNSCKFSLQYEIHYHIFYHHN